MKDKEVKENSNPVTPKWLKTIQLNSWEAELLVSALVLYALFQVPELIRVFSLKSIPAESQLQLFFKIVISAVEIMKLGYILHILVRGIWVASVGLSYVFPKGINNKQLKFKGKFRKELETNTSIVKNVLRLEELSSLVYGVSFLLFGALIGFGFYLFTLIYTIEVLRPLLDDNFYAMGIFGIFMLFYIFLSALVFIDFITNGYFRRKNWSSDWFYPVAFFFRIVTLSFFYRRSLLVLISNTKGWKAHLIPLIIFGVIFGFVQINKKLRQNERIDYLTNAEVGAYYSSNYEDLRSKKDVLITTIQSDIIGQNTLKIFLKDLGVLHKINRKEYGSENNWNTLPIDLASERLNKWLDVRIDSVEIADVKWFRSQHPVDYEFGLISFIDLQSLSNGGHNLTLSFDTTSMSKRAVQVIKDEDYNFKYLSNIHFIYDN